MKKTLEELLDKARSVMGDDTSDAALELIEDLSDTINDLSERADDQTDWKSKYDELDQTWRQRYRDRFYSGDDLDGSNAGADEPDPIEDPEENHDMTYESLFKPKEG